MSTEGLDQEKLGPRAGWRVMLQGPGAHALGTLFAEYLQLLPDASDCGLRVATGAVEHYTLYTQAAEAEDASARLHDACRRAMRELLPLLDALEQLQRLDLQAIGEAAWELRGCLSHSLVPA